MTTQQAEHAAEVAPVWVRENAIRATELAAFFLHDDREPLEVPVPQGPYAPSERALIHTVMTEGGAEYV